MEVRILGRVEVTNEGATIQIEGPKERAILSALALEAGTPVTSGRLCDVLWGDEPPETATKTLQWHVSRLRRSIGTDIVVTEPGGYSLGVAPEDVDAIRFERLLVHARDLLLHDDPAAAAQDLESALDLWSGAPLTDGADSDYRTGQDRRFAELHTLAHERLVEAELGLGHHESMIPRLHAMIAVEPYRDRPRELLMLALYRAGRQADALRSYADYRKLLVEELGIDPSEGVRELEERILRQDPQLDHRPPPPPSNLPRERDPIIGRSGDVGAVIDAIGPHTIVTLVGAGGMGKSRLALAVAHQIQPTFRDGTWWIDLAALRPHDDLAEHIAATLGATPAPGQPAISALAVFLARRDILIVLDNCEHLLSEAAELGAMLVEAGPGVRVLTTSRAALGQPSERRIVVGPLAIDSAEDRPSEAEELFRLRASEHSSLGVNDDEGTDIADLCRMLGGIPLAIELAAARSDVHTAREIIGEIEATGRLPSRRETPEHVRQENLNYVLDWSYAMLEPEERAAYDKLAVFRGAFDLDAAAEVLDRERSSAGHLLGRFLAASMVVPADPGSGVRRFRLLEPLRLYARSHLDDEAYAAASTRHADYYRSFCSESSVYVKKDVTGWRERVLLEDRNITAAIEWSLAQGNGGSALPFADNIGDAWYRSGQYQRCSRVLAEMLEHAADAPPALRASARNAFVWPAMVSGESQTAFAQVSKAIEEAEEAGNAVELAWARWSLAHMLVLGVGDFTSAFPLYDAAIEAAGSDLEQFGSLTGLGVAARAQARAMADIEAPDDVESLDRAERLLTQINDISGLAHVWMARSIRAIREGDVRRIRFTSDRTIHFGRLVSEPVYEHVGLFGRAVGELLGANLPSALDTTYQSVRICEATHNLLQLGVSTQALGMAAIEIGQFKDGAALYGAGISLAAPWPLFERIYASYLEKCASVLGDDFDEVRASGAELSVEEVLSLAASVRIRPSSASENGNEAPSRTEG